MKRVLSLELKKAIHQKSKETYHDVSVKNVKRHWAFLETN